MPLRLEALTNQERSEIFAWILARIQEANDVFATKKDGKPFAVMSFPLCDSITGEEIGKYVFTLSIDAEQQHMVLLDADIILDNETAAKLTFDRKLPGSSEANEYYEVVAEEQGQHLVVETVNRYCVPDEIEGTERDAFVSAFPFALTIFESREAFNEFCGFKKPIQVGKTDWTVDGLGTTFACPGEFLMKEDDGDPWSFVVGTIRSFREIKISFGSIQRDAYLVILHSALGDLPTLVGKELFDTSKMEANRIVGMKASVKANFVKDQYPKNE